MSEAKSLFKVTRNEIVRFLLSDIHWSIRESMHSRSATRDMLFFWKALSNVVY